MAMGSANTYHSTNLSEFRLALTELFRTTEPVFPHKWFMGTSLADLVFFRNAIGDKDVELPSLNKSGRALIVMHLYDLALVFCKNYREPIPLVVEIITDYVEPRSHVQFLWLLLETISKETLKWKARGQGLHQSRKDVKGFQDVMKAVDFLRRVAAQPTKSTNSEILTGGAAVILRKHREVVDQLATELRTFWVACPR